MNTTPLPPSPPSPLQIYTALQEQLGSEIMLLESGVQDDENKISLIACRPLRRVAPTENLEETLRTALAECADMPENPYFSGGLFGSLSFESTFDMFPKYPQQHQGQLPLALLYEFGTVLIVDHGRGELVELATDGHELNTPQLLAAAATTELPTRDILAEPAEDLFEPQISRDDYLQKVEEARELIYAGETFQLVLANTFRTPLRDASSVTLRNPAARDVSKHDETPQGDIEQVAARDIYTALRELEPTTHLILADYGKYGSYTCASPEILGKKTGDDILVSPIAGTRRIKSSANHAAVVAELTSDPKENAEHDMLVDLGRNDLGRVAQPGTVEVTSYKYTRSYAHVAHILSDVTATIAPEYDVVDFLRAIFPAGTLSGAPKIRTLDFIQKLEAHARGLYGGATGWLEKSGNMHMAINIRGAHVRDGEIRIQAGAGIVKDSISAHEWKEIMNKTYTLRRVISSLSTD